MNPEILGAEETLDVSSSEAREELERVLSSATFRRSANSQKFLQYVCGLKLRGEGSRINEYLLGIELFSRGPEYSPSEDAIVRRSAHTVRQKLDAYYANEGRHNAARLEIPIGHYEPVFRRQNPVEEPPKPWLNAQLPLTRGRLRVVAALAAVGAACLVAGWGLGRWSLAQSNASPAIEEIWGNWLTESEGVSIVFANSKTAVVHHVPDETLRDRHPLHFSLPPAAELEMRKQFGFPQGGYVFIRPSDLKTAVAESTSGVHLGHFFGKWRVPVRATQSRLLNWESIRRGRYIFLGHNEANPWVDKLLAGYAMKLGDSQGIQRFISVDQPANGEAARYAKEVLPGKEPVTEYALVSMLPGYQPGSSILLISGLDGQATQLAAEYLTRESTLQELLGKLRNLSPSHLGPWHFQFVLKAEVRDKVPTQAQLSAVRIIDSRRP